MEQNGSQPATDLDRRVADRVRAWGLVVERRTETETSVLVDGHRGTQAVVLKVIKSPGDEWRSGEVLDAFAGNGMIRVLDYVGGAALLERLRPATSLAQLCLSGKDDEATDILADVIGRMGAARCSSTSMPSVQTWAKSFEQCQAAAPAQIPRHLLDEAHGVFVALCASQSRVRLLHGDLHHHNVAFDSARGWLAIDPKGVVGELEYELGAALRNPYDMPELFTNALTIEKRVDRLAGALCLDAWRVLGWTFAQAILSAIWLLEDGYRVEIGHPSIALARVLRPMVKALSVCR